MFKKKAKEKKIKSPRFQTFRDAYAVTKQVKPWITVALVGIFAVTWAIGIAFGASVNHPFYFGFIFLPGCITCNHAFLHPPGGNRCIHID